MVSSDSFQPVSIRKCPTYGADDVSAAIMSALSDIGCDVSLSKGKKVCIKPNLLMKSNPEKAVTTHPSVVRETARIFCEAGAFVTIAESGGGSYTPESMRNSYKACGVTQALSGLDAVLNEDPSTETLSFDGVSSKLFEVLRPLADADIIVDLCKLKTHGLTGMTCAVKNMFGAVPGVKKFETHARYGRDAAAFMNYAVDICRLLESTHEFVAICDAVECMEGNGPSGGTPKHVGAILASRSPYMLDEAAADISGLSSCALMLPLTEKRGLSKKPDGAGLRGDDISGFRTQFRRADSAVGFALTNIPGFMKPRPHVDPSICRGCGECASNCPEKTITMVKKSGRTTAKIKLGGCIRCYCCQELCRFKAVEVKRIPVAELANRIGFMR